MRLESLSGWVWGALTADWEAGFSALSRYVEETGHARVPARGKTKGGYLLGRWVSRQLANRDNLTAKQVLRLESLSGWVWDPLTADWEAGFSALSSYVEATGHARVPLRFKTKDGYALGGWTSTQRRQKDNLTAERLLRLESLNGWTWDALAESWEAGFSALSRYVEATGHARVPYSYKTKDGYKLGSWISRQRRQKDNLTSEQVLRLESLSGWVWDPLTADWETGFSALSSYVEATGHARVPARWKTQDGFNLGNWISNQRKKRDSLTAVRLSRLESISGWVWDARAGSSG